MLIREIELQNILSFGPEALRLDLKPLNVLIGPNGSGKSNLIDIVRLLQAVPTDVSIPIRKMGGVQDWIWRCKEQSAHARIGIVIENNPVTDDQSHSSQYALHYVLEFMPRNQKFHLTYESLTDGAPKCGDLGSDLVSPNFYLTNKDGIATILARTPTGDTRHFLRYPNSVENRSTIAQHKDPYLFPELSYVGDKLDHICIYDEWRFGRDMPLKRPQQSDVPNGDLAPDGSNLGLILSKFRRTAKHKERFLSELRKIYEDVTDFEVIVEGGTIQIFLREGKAKIPAYRLSDGSLRYLYLLSILCSPDHVPLICIEGPELGLHPDLLPNVASLLREASERTQLIVTTHSDILGMYLTPVASICCGIGRERGFSADPD